MSSNEVRFGYGSGIAPALVALAAAIKTILIADLVMSLDNVLAVAAAAKGDIPLLVIGIPLAYVIAPDALRRVTLIAVLVLLLIVELLNTGLEKLADVITRGA